jgi:hypothetical protein
MPSGSVEYLANVVQQAALTFRPATGVQDLNNNNAEHRLITLLRGAAKIRS